MASRLALATLICLALAACDGGAASDPGPGTPTPAPSPAPAPSPGPTPSPGSPDVVIRGGERLVWDQVAATLQELRSFTFRLYVDGNPANLGDMRCGDVRQTAGYECSGILPSLTPGRHVLQLTALGNGLESGRSGGLSVMVINALVPADDPAATSSQLTIDGICVDAAAECFAGRRIASGLGAVTAVTPLPGSGALLIENGHAVRAIEGDVLLSDAALVHDRGGRLVSLALAQDFEQSRVVYVASTDIGRSGDEQLSITRYRELQGVLAQGATIVTGLPIPRNAAAPIAVDDAGMLYVALPGLASAADLPRGTTTAFNSSILRFNADGTVPRTNPSPSPVFAQGYSQPEALVWDAAGRRLLLSGADARSPVTVSAVPLEPSSLSEAWPWSPLAVVLDGKRETGVRPPSLALTAGPANVTVRSLWVVSAPGVVQRASVGPDDYRLQLTDASFGAIGAVTQIADLAGAGLLAVTVETQPTGEVSSVWRLAPSR